MDPNARKRLFSLVYGLYYPAVLGTAVVVILLRVSNGSVRAPAISVALIAGIFFSLSFASAAGFEEKYGWCPLILDVAEVIGMFYCLDSLGLLDVASPFPRSVRVAYSILLALLGFQLLWRIAMKLQWNAYLDLKVILVLLMAIGIWLANSSPWAHWTIAGAFALLAYLYVSGHPYDPGERLPRSFVWTRLSSKPKTGGGTT